MGLCGKFRCGCGVTSSPSTQGAINGELPSIVVTGSGEPLDPYDLTFNDAWAVEVADGFTDTQAFRDTFHAVTSDTSVTGIAAAGTTLSAVSATLTLIIGQPYLVVAFVPLRFGIGDTASVTGALEADAVAIVNFNQYKTYISNERFNAIAFNVWTPAAASVDFTLNVATSSSTMQTNAASTRGYGYALVPIGT